MNVFLTGATGLLGGELLISLSQRKEISKIYCLVRAGSESDAQQRINGIFSLRNDFFDTEKVIPVIGNLTDDELPHDLIADGSLKKINIIIHAAANTSFSKIHDEAVENVNISGLDHIISWAKKLPDLQTFVYIGTATICGEGVRNRLINEDESPNENSTHFVKYTHTKMLGEMAVQKAFPEDKVLIVRPSIIMGDSRPIFPRSPVILWSLATANVLRLLPVNQFAALDIIPVDYATAAIVELLFAKRNHTVYHVSSGHQSVSDTARISGAIAGYFPDRPAFKFVSKDFLIHMKKWSKQKLLNGSPLHEHQEYLDYWVSSFGGNGKLRILLAGMEEYLKFMELGQVFDNTRLLQDTTVGLSSPAHVYIKNSVQYLDKIDVFDGALDP